MKVIAPLAIVGLPGADVGGRLVGMTASGPPVAGTFEVDDYVIDGDGLVFRCSVAGTPGTWVGGGGAAGPQGDQGPQGADGPQGAAGAQGTQGPRGLQGATGTTGTQGPQGTAGATGSQGPQGTAGSTGATGSQGPQGTTGGTGATGPQGDVGATGAQGPQGTAGSTGATGSQGPQGTAGATGATGPQGDVGATGSTGAQGATGAQGFQGTQGTQGPVGPQGVQGSTGAQGTTGAQGVEGQAGGGSFAYTFDTGTTAADPGAGKLRFNNATVSSVTHIYIDKTDAAGSDLTSWFTNLASPWGVVKVFDNSNAGAFALFALTAVTNNTAYFDFTVTYVASAGSLDTTAGDTVISYAAQGATGSQGPQGTQGTTGAQGTQGPTGAQGFQGTQGTQGPTGAQGFQGTQGPTGPQGFQGTQGPTGAQGFQGTQGTQGVEGQAGGDSFAYTFDTGTSNADPGAGKLRLDNATVASAAHIYIDKADAAGSDLTSWFTSLASPWGTIKVFDNSNAAVFALFTLTAVTNHTSYFDLAVTYITSAGSLDTTAGDTVISYAAQGATGVQGATGAQGVQGAVGAQGVQGSTGAQGVQGSTGAQGVQGSTGAQGVQGSTGAQGIEGQPGGDSFAYTFDTGTSDADPGAGKLRLNNASPGSATFIYIDQVNAQSDNVSAWLSSLTVGSVIKLFDNSNSGNFALYVLGTVTNAAPYFKLAVTAVANAGTLGTTAGDTVISYAAKGATGAQGAQGAPGAQGSTGAQGTQGAAGVNSPESFYLPSGAQYETFSRIYAESSTAGFLAGGTGRLQLIGIYLPTGLVIGHIAFMSGGTAAGTPTHWWFALFDGSRVMLAQTADQTSTTWAANTLKSIAIAKIASGAASTFTTTFSGLHYLGVMVTAATVPTFMGHVDGGGTNLISLAPVYCGAADSGLTTPPAFPFTAASLGGGASLGYGYVAA